MMEAFIIFVLSVSCFTLSSVAQAHPLPAYSPFKPVLGQQNLGLWKDGILSSSDAEAPGPYNDPSTSTLILAAKRTKRPDILSGLRKYRGGWDIANKHYWASVGFTGAATFILAVLWFLSFGLALLVYHCLGWRINIKGKERPQSVRICLILLILFTCAAAIGCILLAVGQGEFHHEAMHTLNYVVNQSDYTVNTLRNVTEYMELAKTVSVAQVFLPSDVKDDIDHLNTELNVAANTLEEKTNENSAKIERVFNDIRSALIAVAALMLVMSILGLVLSVLGYQHVIHVFVLSGWLLVAITFVLCGVFVIFNNVISDTCMAMKEWVDNPQAETALSNILPCVDQSTTNQTLWKSKQVSNDIVNIVNSFVDSYANKKRHRHANPGYYNQSGPFVPHLCYPYDAQLQENNCSNSKVSMTNASLVWQSYTCSVSPEGMCTSPGRLTPQMYMQMLAAVNISYALDHYTPPLLSFQNCNFVRETFRNITLSYCPSLERYLRTVNTGLAMISVGVMLSLALWILYANRPQREEVFAKLSLRIKSGCSDNNNNVVESNHRRAPPGATSEDALQIRVE